ncbi:bifunctional serine/threonine-protein kinase/glutamate ABC transporter substrate-binding protein [Streptomyces sp. NPDC057695]|uniref:bifunctional serine/threonine-protein kinase/glutamate ABC transporter substrate-binding protein n=1 Tax=Streptomyces sp. NPDC057695 TaxID=3346217 RepID=UPI00368790E5
MVDDRFELVERLGGGGMGTVWRARDLALHRDVALKEVRPPDPSLAEYDPEAARQLRIRVLREARALARVAHPHVVTVHHIVDGGEGTYPWLVMELVPGGSLQDRLDRGVLAASEAAALGRGILAGLRAAHAAGIQHRDVKPPNVLIRPDGQPVLTDFGIAAIHGATALTAAGSIIGTPDYMAPERVRGEEGGPAADFWSLAMTLYVAVEGRHPLRRANTLATLAAVLGEDVPPPRRAGALTEVLTAVLVRDPAARPDGETLDRMLARAAEAAADAHAARARRPAPPPPSRPPSQGEPEDRVPGENGHRGHPFVDPAADTATAFSAAPPPPPGGHPTGPGRRGGLYVAAVAVSGALLWNLLPLGGNDGDEGRQGGQGPSAASSAPSGSSPSSGASGAAPTGTGGTITIGIKFDQPGLGFKNPDGTYAGLDVDVATYVARALGHDPADIVWKEALSATRESLLTNGTVDLVVATYTITAARDQKVDFVGPYLTAHQDVLLSADDTSVTRPTDLNGRKVCSATGSTSALRIRTALAPQAQVVSRDSYRACLADLDAGTVDAVTTDNALLAGYVAHDPYEGRFRLAGFDASDEPYGIGVPEGGDAKGTIRRALQKMIDDGSWKRAVERNLPLLKDTAPPVLRATAGG